MTQSIVLELQELASNGNNDISDLLRKALLVSTKLGLLEFRSWTLAELNGYTGELRDNLPEYRITFGELKAFNPSRGFIPFQVPHQLNEILTKVNITESVHSLEQLMATAKSGVVLFNFSAEQTELLMSWQGDYLQFRPTRFIGINRLMAIFGAVRTTILEWSLRLEADGILGEGLSFSAKEKQNAMSNIHIQNFQGILGNIDGGSSVTQHNSQHIAKADFSTLAKHLTKSGVEMTDVQELEQAVEDDETPASASQFGPRVSAWIGKMVGKAASGSWEISVGAAGGFLGNALGKYYGFG